MKNGGKYKFMYKYKRGTSVYETESASLYFISEGCKYSGRVYNTNTDEQIILYITEKSSIEHAIRLVTRYADLSSYYDLAYFVVKCGDVEHIMKNVIGYLL